MRGTVTSSACAGGAVWCKAARKTADPATARGGSPGHFTWWTLVPGAKREPRAAARRRRELGRPGRGRGEALRTLICMTASPRRCPSRQTAARSARHPETMKRRLRPVNWSDQIRAGSKSANPIQYRQYEPQAEQKPMPLIRRGSPTAAPQRRRQGRFFEAHVRGQVAPDLLGHARADSGAGAARYQSGPLR